MKLYIPVGAGLEAALKRELFRLGYGSPPAVRGRVALEGDWADVARLNVCLRAGERVLLGVGDFFAPDFDALFDGVRALPWEEYLTAHTMIRIDGKSVESKLGAVKAAGGVIKKAILERLRDKLHASVFDEKGERAVVGFSLYRDEIVLTLDTSGDGLHKRGYRVLSYDAPLRETTAAAIIEDSFYRADKPFADPFCGSGTFPVEAALYARGIAPGKGRAFDCERWKCTPRGVFAAAREDAKEGERKGEIAPIYASDISPRAVEIAKEHARRAGVFGDIRFAVKDARELNFSEKYGVIAANPPYGARLEGGTDLFPLYRDFARAFFALSDWSLYLLSGYEGAERAFGRAAKRKIVYNSDIRCGLYAYYGKKP